MHDHDHHAAHGTAYEERGKPLRPKEHKPHGDHHEHMVADFRRRFWVSLALTVPVVVLSPGIWRLFGLEFPLAFPGFEFAVLAIASVIYFYGDYPFYTGLVSELRKRQPGMMVLIGLATTVAYVYSAAVVFGLPGDMLFWELSTLITVMLLGHWIEMRSIMGASKALEELAALMPSQAHVIESDGTVRDVPLDELKPGDRFLVKPGEKIPADGEIVEGETSIDESMITGESEPVAKKPGDGVIGGAVNAEGSIKAEVKKTGKDTFLSQVVSLVEQAQQSKSKTQTLADRAAMWLTFIAIGAGAITLVVWAGVVRMPFDFSLQRTVTVMVITCPHALGLAVPLVVAVSTALSARHGLLVRNRLAFEQARNLNAIIFDKTGTLTEGRFAVERVVSFDEAMPQEELMNYAASVEAESEHPIAKAIVDAAGGKQSVKDFHAIPGKGAMGNVAGKAVKVVSRGYLQESGIKLGEQQARLVDVKGRTPVFVIVDDSVRGAVLLADVIRPESREAVARLKDLGVRSIMLTGDHQRAAEWVAEELGLSEYFYEVLPEQKAEKVKEVQASGAVVAMAGDGINDAPALAQADLGIAIGAGTDVAIEAADVVLVRNNPLDAVQVIALSKATYRKMIENLLWATGYNVVAIPLAAGVLYAYGVVLSPAMGAVLMAASTVIVAINARRLKI